MHYDLQFDLEQILVLNQLDLPHREVHLYGGEGLPRETGDLEGLIVMGGPMGVGEVRKNPYLIDELQLIENIIKDKKPVLGICLGAQLIAKALGARVYKNRQCEVGWYPIQTTSAGSRDANFKKIPTSNTIRITQKTIRYRRY